MSTPTDDRPHVIKMGLAAIWVIFLCKGIFYSLLFPIWEGFDEYAHFAFIQYLAIHHHLSVPDTRVSHEIDRSLELVPLPRALSHLPSPHVTHDTYWHLSSEERSSRQRDLLEIPKAWQAVHGDSYLYEGQQGPLYYWLMSPIYSVIQKMSLPSRVFIFRLLNVLLASSVLPIAFLAAKRVFSDDQMAIGVCALITAMPELYIDVSRVGNQVLAMVFFGLFTLQCLSVVGGGARCLILAGAVLGLLLLTKAYGLAGIPALVVVAIHFVRNSSLNKLRSVLASLASLAVGALIAGWWFLRNFKLAGAIIWVGGTPSGGISVETFTSIKNVSWVSAFHSLFGSHIWIGNWSFLGVRSWMYEVFQYVTVLIAAGILLLIIRGFGSNSPDSLLIRRSYLLVLLMIYGGFLGSIAYHVLVNFISSKISASSGWYLYAVVVPEAILAIAGLFAFRWGKSILIGVIACFALLEIYATHWILIPYYTGLIAHRPDGGLQAFYLSQVKTIGILELLARLEINRPSFLTNVTLIGSWSLFITTTLALAFVSGKYLLKQPLKNSGRS